MRWNDYILQGAARALFVCAWADRQEERGKTKGWAGNDLMDLAPRTPRDAVIAAACLITRVECASKASIWELVARAAKADGYEDAGEARGGEEKYLTDFGHYLAMQAIGHGVSWFDHHEKFEITIPHCESIFTL